jgi:hypothetical protein
LSSFFLPYIFISIYRQNSDALAQYQAQAHFQAPAQAEAQLRAQDEPQFKYQFKTLAEARAQALVQAEDSDSGSDSDQPAPHKLTPVQLQIPAEITTEEGNLKLDLDKKKKSSIRKKIKELTELL